VFIVCLSKVTSNAPRLGEVALQQCWLSVGAPSSACHVSDHGGSIDKLTSVQQMTSTSMGNLSYLRIGGARRSSQVN
jgi:hypothetical protein